MAIHFECANCGKKYQAPESKAGKKGKCGKCGAELTVPLIEDLTAGDRQPQAEPPPGSPREAANEQAPGNTPPVEKPKPKKKRRKKKSPVLPIIVGLVIVLGAAAGLLLWKAKHTMRPGPSGGAPDDEFEITQVIDSGHGDLRVHFHQQKEISDWSDYAIWWGISSKGVPNILETVLSDPGLWKKSQLDIPMIMEFRTVMIGQIWLQHGAKAGKNKGEYEVELPWVGDDSLPDFGTVAPVNVLILDHSKSEPAPSSNRWVKLVEF